MMSSLLTHTRFHRLDHLSLKGLRALDRDHTVVLLPVGMIEEHGDHLPLGTDNFAVDGVTLSAAAWLMENDRDLHVLMMPAIPYGTDPVDTRRSDLFTQAGSVWISRETLKSIVADVAGHMARYGFQYIFPVSFHGGPEQCVVLEEVCAEMRAANPGLVMFEPAGYVMAGAELDMTPGVATLLGRPLTTKEEVALRGSIHASMFETSMMLSLRPDLVDPSYKSLRTIEWNQMYEMPDWPGYVGAGPAHANADVGGAVLRWRGVRAGALIRRAMTGEDLSGLSRHPKWRDEPDEDIEDLARESDLARVSEPSIDSKPVMFISAEKLRDRYSGEQPSASLSEPTPRSSMLETRPIQPKNSDEQV
ncbi:MAG: creatininase family protein [Anaerolineae bacterium]|nr:creatininase family protein [Anaerolineae bacterium]